MQKPVLVATDFSEASDGALHRAAYEASRAEAPLIAMHCVEVSGNRDRWSQFVRRSGFQTSQIRTEALGRLDERFNEVVDEQHQPTHVNYHVEVGRAPDRIRAVAEEEDAGLIVLGGSEGGAFERLMLGSVSEEVVRSATRPVMVVPVGFPVDPVDEILAPVDFSECSRASLREAAEWAERTGARLAVLHVFQSGARVPPFDFGRESEDDESLRERAAEQLDELIDAEIPEGVEVERIVKQGAPGETIRAVATRRVPDLLVMGTHGRRGLEQFIVGSTALDVLRQARWPVVTVRH